MSINDRFLNDFVKTAEMRYFAPSLYRYLRDFLEIEKVREYNDQYIISTFIPPYPGKPFDRFLKTYFGQEKRTAIQSVDLAVTNGCIFNCWHCYNAGRKIDDLATETLQNIVQQLQELGAIVVNFTGGEPCLRNDLPEICSALNDDAVGILATTGYGFTDDMAKRLRDTRVYSISLSLDSADEIEHDRRRNVRGAYQIALKGIETALKHGFYTYTCAVPSKKLLEPENFQKLVELNKRLGVHELQIIEPAPAGKIIAAKPEFGMEDFGTIFQFMALYNNQDDYPAISSFAHMESPEYFGCGAGYSHIYIDGTGEVSPCNMMPISYGNAARDELKVIIEKMQTDMKHPYPVCLAYALQDYFKEVGRINRPVRVGTIPSIPYPETNEQPRFFNILNEKQKEIAGTEEIVLGYNSASATYDDYWLSVASTPIDELFERLGIKNGEKGLDCGCGTGYTSAKLAERVGEKGSVLSIDLSPGMIEKANIRMAGLNLNNVELRTGNVLEELKKLPERSFDTAVLTWLIGYVGCREIFPLLKRLLKPGGQIGFVAHLDRSPQVPLEIFEEIIRENPDSLIKTVSLKFPSGLEETKNCLEKSEFEIGYLKEGTFDFICHEGHEVYDHIMKSGAGTTFYYALRPTMRKCLAEEFIRRIEARFKGQELIRIEHRYIIGIGVTGTIAAITPAMAGIDGPESVIKK
jgi:MoaA/NifB/PqqE/SkfB family radical SAM enzyme/ubiquinone/menaquinone biosynthesis C-methylase UbiE